MPEINKTVSIIIPTFNEGKNIGACLDAIAKNTVQGLSIEIILIDGGSRDNTVAIASEYALKGLLLNIIDAPGTSVYSALNIGLDNATGEYIVRVDARSIIPENYIVKCLENLHAFDASVAGGVQKQFGTDLYQKTIAAVLQSPFGTGNAKFRTGNFSGYVDTVYLGVFKRETFKLVGKYDDDGIVISEDAMMNARIKTLGGKIYLDGSLIVKYPAKNSLKELARQYFIYGGAKAHTFEKYKKLTAVRQFIPLIALACFILLLVLTIIQVIPLFIICIPIVVYIIFVIKAALGIKFKEKASVSFFIHCSLSHLYMYFGPLDFSVGLFLEKRWPMYFFKQKRNPNLL
jgi:succinoglycan biosynthesis protein ExoA